MEEHRRSTALVKGRVGGLKKTDRERLILKVLNIQHLKIRKFKIEIKN